MNWLFDTRIGAPRWKMWLWFKFGWHVRQAYWRMRCRLGHHRLQNVLAVQSHWAGFQVCTVCGKGHDPFGLGREEWPQ